MESFEKEVAETAEWLSDPRFQGLTRLYSARQVVEQQGTIQADYAIARTAAQAFFARLRRLFSAGEAITTFGPYSPGQAVAMKRIGIEGIYLGGWATSAKGSIAEDPGADLASYPLSQVPDEAAPIVRALLTADKNQRFARSRMTQQERAASPEVDYRPFIIADADTGHGGDAHVRNLIRQVRRSGSGRLSHRRSEAGLQEVRASGRQGSRPSGRADQAAECSPLPAGHHEGPRNHHCAHRCRSSHLVWMGGATSVIIRSFWARRGSTCRAARWRRCQFIKRFYDLGMEEVNGHLLYRVPDQRLRRGFRLARARWNHVRHQGGGRGALCARQRWTSESAWTRSRRRCSRPGRWKPGSRRMDGPSPMRWRSTWTRARQFEMAVDEWLDWSGRGVVSQEAREKARSMGVNVIWDSELSRTSEGYYPIEGGVEYAISRSLNAAPFADIVWMETKTAEPGRCEALRRCHPCAVPGEDAVLQPVSVLQLGYHRHGPKKQMSRFSRGTWEARLRLQLHHLRRPPGRRCGGGGVCDRLEAGRDTRIGTAAAEDPVGRVALQDPTDPGRGVASRCRSHGVHGTCRHHQGHGQGITQTQHLVQTEVPPSLLERWLEMWTQGHQLPHSLRVELRPHTAGSDLLALSVLDESRTKVAGVVFATIQDRRGRTILSIRDQNTFDSSLRKKRLMTLLHSVPDSPIQDLLGPLPDPHR